MAYCRWFKQISKKDVPVAGGKGANLGEMFNAGFPVPPGFVITADAYRAFLKEKKLDKKIQEKLDSLDVENTELLQATAKEIQNLILQYQMSHEMKEEIQEFYQYLDTDEELRNVKLAESLLKNGRDLPFVAVRSSATAEDLPQASFAGQQATFLNIKGKDNVTNAVQKCWASLFTARAIYYRAKNNFPHMKVAIAVVVQKQINSEKSGVMFSINPATNDIKQVVIEAAWGLGEAVVSGEVNPNTYVLEKESGKILEKDIPGQTWMFTRNEYTGDTVKKNVPSEKQKAQVLLPKEIDKLWELALEVEKHYDFPQDIEWAIERNKVYLVQTRPVTTIKPQEEKVHITGEPILKGLGASPGHASGSVKLVLSMAHLDKVQKGDILVTKMTTPDFVPAMQRAAAIVTDEGGITAHAAIVSREMGIPCVVGTEKATQILKDGDVITVDGSAGNVYKGKITIESAPTVAATPVSGPTTVKVKVIMDLPEFAERAAETGADGIGLLRLEGIIASGKMHPAKYLRDNNLDEYTNLIYEGVKKIATPFKDKPVWVRTSDIRTDEYRGLAGGEEEPQEANPMIGWHGIRRSLSQPELLKAEFRALKKLIDEGFTNLGVMIPFVISPDEIAKAKMLAEEVGLKPRTDIKFGVMIETPAAAMIIEGICETGIDFISIGSNDLTQTILGVDRGNKNIASLYSEFHPAVVKAIEHVIKVCKKFGVESSICGQIGSDPKMAKLLVEAGIDSISANPDAVQQIRQVVAQK
ncbi:MAG: phosphoenolpyruvate synthase [Candidatus Nanoarchaeia archaeon]